MEVHFVKGKECDVVLKNFREIFVWQEGAQYCKANIL